MGGSPKYEYSVMTDLLWLRQTLCNSYSIGRVRRRIVLCLVFGGSPVYIAEVVRESNPTQVHHNPPLGRANCSECARMYFGRPFEHP